MAELAEANPTRPGRTWIVGDRMGGLDHVGRE